jgi:hypothetical protein
MLTSLLYHAIATLSLTRLPLGGTTTLMPLETPTTLRQATTVNKKFIIFQVNITHV